MTNKLPVRLRTMFDIVFKALTTDNWDAVYCIVGDEGVSKSTLGLHILDYWYTCLNGECKAEDVKHMCLDREQFVTDLKDLKKFECTIFDEAGDIDSRRSMSDFNTNVRKAYQVIRGDNLLTILILPSLWDLDTFFRNRRLRGLFVVYKRGQVKYWDKSKLRYLMAINESRPIKFYDVVRPTFISAFPKYNGVLFEPYMAKKKIKMEKVRQELFDSVMTEKQEETQTISKKDARLIEQRHKLALLLKQKGMTYESIASYLGIDVNNFNKQNRMIQKKMGSVEESGV